MAKNNLIILGIHTHHESGASIVKNGESLFKGNCTVCHGIDDVIIGPALRDVHERRSEEWIYSFVKNSQKVIRSGDEYAVNLYNEYNKTLMTSFDFSNEDFHSFILFSNFEEIWLTCSSVNSSQRITI